MWRGNYELGFRDAQEAHEISKESVGCTYLEFREELESTDKTENCKMMIEALVVVEINQGIKNWTIGLG